MTESSLAFECHEVMENAFYGPLGRYGFNRLFIEDPRRGLRIQVEKGKRLTFPVYVPDVVDAILASFQRARVGEVYNICDRPITHAAVNQLVSRLMGIDHRRLLRGVCVGR